MKIERFEIAGLAQYSYIVASDGKAAVIDPMRDIDRYTTYAREQRLTIAHILETHIHADFAAGSLALAAATRAELALSAHDEGEHYRYRMPHQPIADGDSIAIGSVRLRALHTPGHTPEHLSFLLFDNERSATEPVALFSGDFLFVDSAGRPDLLGEEAKQRLARELFHSHHRRIHAVPDGTVLYPGHGAGSLCGAGMSERAESTLGYERATNHLFRLSEEAFVSEILGSVPPMPAYYPRMKQLNADGAPPLSAIPGDKPLSPAEVAALARHPDVLLLDLRRPEAFGGAHIRNAINIGAGQNLSQWAGWLLDPHTRIVLISEAGDDEDSRRALTRVGLDRIEGFLDEGMPAWINAGYDFARTPQLSAREAERRSAETLVLDVRTDQEWNDGHIPGASHVMLGELPDRLPALRNDQEIVTVCGTGYRSSIAASLLARSGFGHVSNMDGGMTAWTCAGLPAPSNQP
jgi:hydroxyacylglutathione hydrolase